MLFWFGLNLRTLSIVQFKMFDFDVFASTFSLVAKKVQKRKEQLVRGEFE